MASAGWFFLVPYYLFFVRNHFVRKRRRIRAKDRFQQVLAAAQPDAIAIDCGANVGYVTGLFLEKGLEVHSFEPDPVAADRLLQRHGDKKKLIFHPAAVCVESGKARLFRRRNFESAPLGSTESSSLLKRKTSDDDNYVEVEVVNLIEYLKTLPKNIAIMKMDIEGSEVALLEKMLDTEIYKKIDFLLVETHEGISLSCAFRTAKLRAKIKALHLADKINLDHH